MGCETSTWLLGLVTGYVAQRPQVHQPGISFSLYMAHGQLSVMQYQFDGNVSTSYMAVLPALEHKKPKIIAKAM